MQEVTDRSLYNIHSWSASRQSGKWIEERNEVGEMGTPEVYSDVERKTGICDLPDGCLIEIISRVGHAHVGFPPRYAPGPRRASVMQPLACAVVCKRWNSLAVSAVRSLHFTPGLLNEEELDVLKRCKELRSLTVVLRKYCIQPEFPQSDFARGQVLALLKALRELPLLKELGLAYDSHNCATLWHGLSAMTKLQQLHLRSSIVPPTSAGFLRSILRSLYLECYSCDELHRLLGHGSRKSLCCELREAGNLRALETFSFSSERPIVVPESLGSLSGLTRLDLHVGMVKHFPYSRKVDIFQDFPQTIGNLDRLRILRMEGCTALPENLPSVTSLEALYITAQARVYQMRSASFSA